jgi:hypothetical protein
MVGIFCSISPIREEYTRVSLRSQDLQLSTVLTVDWLGGRYRKLWIFDQPHTSWGELLASSDAGGVVVYKEFIALRLSAKVEAPSKPEEVLLLSI